MASTKQWDHIPGGFYSMQPAFLPLPCAEQVHFPSFNTNSGQCKFEGTESMETFLLASQYHFNRWFFWGDMWAHAVGTKEKQDVCMFNKMEANPPCQEQCQIHFPTSRHKSDSEGHTLTGWEDFNVPFQSWHPHHTCQNGPARWGCGEWVEIFLLIIQTRPPIHFIGGFAVIPSDLESEVIHPKLSSLAFRFYSF